MVLVLPLVNELKLPKDRDARIERRLPGYHEGNSRCALCTQEDAHANLCLYRLRPFQSGFFSNVERCFSRHMLIR